VSEHDKFRELIEPYALGALDPPERAELEAHLRTNCVECSKALDEAYWLVSQLAHLSPESAPSDILKGRLMRQVRADARSGSSGATIPFWMWAAVAAVLLFAFYNAWDAYQLRDRFRVANESASAAIAHQQELQQQLALAKREAMILTDPASMKFTLPASEKNMPELEVKWHAKMGICIMGHNIPMPPANRTLQLWLIPRTPGAKPMPSMMWRPDANGDFMLMVTNPPDQMNDVKALAVTEEPAGGSPQPTSTPMWLGSVS